MTVMLRPARSSDAAWLATWLPGVAQSVGYADAPDVAAIAALLRDRGRLMRVIEREHGAVGVIVARRNAPDRAWAIVELVATPPGEARRGAGMEAARLLESVVRRAGARRLYAPAPEVHGIAMYFWIRLGYRPLLRPEWPCTREGVAWLVRDI